MTLKKYAAVALIVVGSASLPSISRAQEWKAYTYGNTEQVANVSGLKAIFDEIKAKTGGQISIKLSLGGQLPIKVNTITQAVGDNVVTFGDDLFFHGSVPIGGLLRLPMLIQDATEFTKAYDIVKPQLVAGFDKQGVVLLGYYTYPMQVLFSNKKLTSLDDIKGQKIRVTSPEQAEFVKAFGGTGLTMGPPEVAPALQQGAVDGVITASAGGGKVWGDLLTHRFAIPVSFVDAALIVNKDAFNALKPEAQAAIRAAVAAQAPAIIKALLADEETVNTTLKAKGMTLTDAPKDAQVAATATMKGYWDTWAKAKGKDAEAALAQVRTALGR
jgi:TRAP-type transport system periplasmic protein